MKEQRFRKVVEWGNFFEDCDDIDFLFLGIILMIPVVGQMVWLFILINSLKGRKIYYRRIK